VRKLKLNKQIINKHAVDLMRLIHKKGDKFGEREKSTE